MLCFQSHCEPMIIEFRVTAMSYTKKMRLATFRLDSRTSHHHELRSQIFELKINPNNSEANTRNVKSTYRKLVRFISSIYR